MAKSPTYAIERPTSPAPDAAYVEAIYEQRKTEGDEARLRSLAATFRQLTRQDHKLLIPPQYKAITGIVKTPFVRESWRGITAALTHNPPQVHVEPRDEHQPAKDAANLAERWTMAVDERLTKELGEDVGYEAPKVLVRDGESVIKQVHRPDAWANFPERGGDESADEYLQRWEERSKSYDAPLPFAWRVVDRLSLLFEDGEFGDSWVIEYGEYPRPILGRRYGMVAEQTAYGRRLVNPENTLGGRPQPEGDARSSASGQAIKLEYFDADGWWHVVIDGSDAPGFPKPSPYGECLPYFRAKAPDSESPLYSLMFLVPALDALLTMKMNWAYLGAYPNPVVKKNPNTMGQFGDLPVGDDGQPSKLVWRPGKALELPPGWELTFLAPPPVGSDLDELAVILRQLIEVAGMPSALKGQSGAPSGYLYNQMIAAASATYQRLAQASARQREQAAEWRFKIIDRRIRMPVYAMGGFGDGGTAWLGLKPGKDAGGGQKEAPVGLLGPVSYTFRPLLPTDEQAEAMIATQLTDPGHPLISDRYAREKLLHVEDPEGMADEIAVEKELDTNPVLKAMVIDKALKDAGIIVPTPQPSGLLNAQGAPMAQGGGAMPPEGMSPGMAGLPGASLPSVPGLTMPMRPQAPRGTGPGSPAGVFPGQPPTPAGRVPV